MRATFWKQEIKCHQVRRCGGAAVISVDSQDEAADWLLPFGLEFMFSPRLCGFFSSTCQISMRSKTIK